MTLIRRVATAARGNTLWRAIGFRLRQFAYANSHAGDHYLKLGDGTRRFTLERSMAILPRMAQQPMSFSIDVRRWPAASVRT
jgi:hypothetical protein